MILRIQKSRSFRLTCITLALSLFVDLVLPRQAFALTGGPAQPEFNSFTPIGTSDMVDLSSGDMSYNIPLMDVGGYPLNLAYTGNVSMDQEASHVGLGWNLSVGQINRNVRGIPDDFDGDEIVYENYLKPNVTVGLNFKFQGGLFGIEFEGAENASTTQPNPDTSSVSLSTNVAVVYNNYSGVSIKPGVNISKEYHNGVTVGVNAQSGPDGLNVSPSVNFSDKSGKHNDKTVNLGANFGLSMNSRQGFQGVTMSASRKTMEAAYKDRKDKDPSSNNPTSVGRTSLGSTISYSDPLYTPTKRVGMETSNFTLNAEPGGLEVIGLEGAPEITAYGTIMRVQEEEENKTMKAYGYANTENANKFSILDFNREKDGSFTVNSTNLPITNYTYDIYSVQGQGVSGTYRPYRNQVGYVYDSYVQDGSFSGTLGLEAGTGNLFKLGVDLEASGVASHSGLWSEQTGLQQHLDDAGSNSFDYEKVHYKNVGDLSTDEEFGLFTQTGSYSPVNVPISGFPYLRKTMQALGFKSNANSMSTSIQPIGAPIQRSQRVKRNQAIYNITKAENQDGIGNGPLVYDSQLYSLPTEAKGHHTTEVQITRNDGARYVYGLPAYNTLKREASFSVDGTNSNCSTGLVSYVQSSLDAPRNLPNDKFLNRITTPGYVHTHLLTSILSTDYQDVDNVAGPSVGDFGSYTKFSYTKKESNYKWRVPFQSGMANYNEGLKTDTQDDRGNYVYGEKELYYVDKIETKTHVAIFHYSERKDAKGVVGESGGIGPSSASMYKLDKISLYSVGEYDGLGISSASTPIKEVYFQYSYSLCTGVPNNDTGEPLDDHELSNHGGKLTLKKVYFQYRNSAMGKYTGYRFNYGEYKLASDGNGGFYHPDEYTDPGILATQLNTTYVPPTGTPSEEDYIEAALTTGLNPVYNIKGYDSWGNYKPNSSVCGNLDPLTAAEFPFVEQQDKHIQNNRSAVWCMREINLPSGGKIEVEYESDNYAFVQNKRAMRMYKVYGAGSVSNPTGTSEAITGNIEAAQLFGNPIINKANRYLYVEVGEDISGMTSADIKNTYLKGIYGGPPIYFRFLMNMTKLGGTGDGDDPAKYDYVTGYIEHEETEGVLDAFQVGDKNFISIPVKFVEKEGGLLNSLVNLTNKVHPISKASWHFGRKYLNNQVYGMNPNGDTQNIEEVLAESIFGALSNLLEIFTGPNARLENRNVGRQFIAGKSWLRLNTENYSKYGGGNRVKEIRMSDVWEKMNVGQTNYQTMKYGQRYDYTHVNGTTSGVATYEPVGNKENPFVQPEFTEKKKLLAPDEDNFIEMPFGECFFPSPQVTYARVSVSNLDAGTNPISGTSVKRRNKTGKVVTEFYTSRDFPTIVDQTKLDPFEDKTPGPLNALNILTVEHLTMTQGYVVHLNDMNGKQKSQRVYAEGQTTPISGVDYKYRMHSGNPNYTASNDPDRNKGRLNNSVKIINSDGSIGSKTIGVETDIVFDYRESATVSQTVGVNTNLASFIFGVIPVPVPMLLPDISMNETQFRSVSSTKVINTFGLLEETIAYDAGAAVYTKNLAWDAETGEVLVTETIDEYNDKYYTMNYPAHWYYDGMGQASKNLGLEGSLVASGAGYVISGVTQTSQYLMKGDELLLYGAPSGDEHGWVSNIQGSVITLIDEDGNSITGAAGEFEVMRSGRRNLQSAGIMNVTLMHNPLTDLSGNPASSLGSNFLETTNWAEWKIINAGAVDYSQRWKAPCECDFDNSSQGSTYNPYRMNERGVWRTKSSRTYLAGRNSQGEVTPRRQGFLTEFAPMYRVTSSGNWYKNFTDWTYVAEVSTYSPYGFELENKDALDRYSAAQYGYNNTFPMAVGANTQYREIGFDGFEDYIGFDGCPNGHFTFKDVITPLSDLSTDHSHTGKYSLKVPQSSNSLLTKLLDCITIEQ